MIGECPLTPSYQLNVWSIVPLLKDVHLQCWHSFCLMGYLLFLFHGWHTFEHTYKIMITYCNADSAHSIAKAYFTLPNLVISSFPKIQSVAIKKQSVAVKRARVFFDLIFPLASSLIGTWYTYCTLKRPNTI